MAGRGKTRELSTTARGDAFRDRIATLLESAGYENVDTEVMLAGKKIDVYAEEPSGFHRVRIGFEAKDYDGTLPIHEVSKFTNEYGSVRFANAIDQGVLVSRGPITPQGKQQLDAVADQKLSGMEFHTFQRQILGPDQYLREVLGEYEKSGLDKFYIPARIPGGDLGAFVAGWLATPSNHPLVVLGGYGTGKSTFALRLTAEMAKRSLQDPTARIPIRVQLGHIVDETSPQAIFGKLFTANYGVGKYTWLLFDKLNRLGRFLIIFDGFDEMKHGMTFGTFQRGLIPFVKGTTKCGNGRPQVTEGGWVSDEELLVDRRCLSARLDFRE